MKVQIPDYTSLWRKALLTLVEKAYDRGVEDGVNGALPGTAPLVKGEYPIEFFGLVNEFLGLGEDE